MNAFVLGGTGLVGSKLVPLLNSSPLFSSITLYTRKTVNISFEKVKQVLIPDFNTFDQDLSAFQVGFCSMGTTRGDAGSDAKFIEVDHDIPLRIAKLWKQGVSGNTRFILVSAQGSNASSLLLYPRTKGELERDVSALGFDATIILRPGLLVMDQGESRPSPRHFEAFGLGLVKLFGHPSFACIHASKVAKGMLIAASMEASGTRILEHGEIHKLVDSISS